MSVLKTLGYVGKKRSKIFQTDKPRTAADLIDELESCFEEKWINDRLGGYIETRLNRKKAKKVIETWLKTYPVSE
jgi:hypothetical protein